MSQPDDSAVGGEVETDISNKSVGSRSPRSKAVFKRHK